MVRGPNNQAVVLDELGDLLVVHRPEGGDLDGLEADIGYLPEGPGDVFNGLGELANREQLGAYCAL
jgi:hypothetical protein